MIRYALALLSGLLGILAYAAEPTSVDANWPLTSVTRCAAFVFASTPAGLFRAALETKRWETLQLPPGMPLNGKFARVPDDSPLVFYVVSRSRLDAKARPDSRNRYGLYLSRDQGVSWQIVSDRDDFGAVLFLKNGSLLAVVGADGVNPGHQLLRSDDLGRSWLDITGKAYGPFHAIESDPENPDLIRLHSSGIRFTTFVADTKSYDWELEPWLFPLEKLSRARLFSRDSSSSNRAYTYQATLANYFGYDFGNQKRVNAIEVVPSKTRFTFARGEQVVIPLTVVFHFDPDTTLVEPGGRTTFWDELWRVLRKWTSIHETFADQPDGLDAFWGVRIETAEGQRIVKSPKEPRNVVTLITTSLDGKNVITQSEPEAVAYEVFSLAPGAPYQRNLNLSRRFDFAKSGQYQVQIVYDSEGYPKTQDVWGGSATSPVFTVEIRP